MVLKYVQKFPTKPWFSPMVKAVEGDTYWGSVIRSELVAKAQWKAFHEGKIGKTSRKIWEIYENMGKLNNYK